MLADSKNYDWLVTEDFIRNIKNVRDAAEAELGKFSKRGGVIFNKTLTYRSLYGFLCLWWDNSTIDTGSYY